MQMRDIGLHTPGAKLLSHAIRNDPQTLVAGNSITQLHLNVGKELVLCDPSAAMINDDVAT
jgi:hypothetical protein